MNFIVSSTTLLKPLQHLNAVLNSSNVLPILDNFLFNLDQNVLTITASDLETTMTTKVPVRSESRGIIAVPAKMILDTLKTMPEMPVSFQVNINDYSIEMSAGEGKYHVTGFDGEDFPKVPMIDNPSKLNISSIILSLGINKTIFAAGNDDLRPTMNGVFFQLSPDELTMVATDAHKLVRYKRSDVKSSASASFIVPKKPLNILKNVLANIDTDVAIEYNASNAFFSFGETYLICRLVDGKYPNYEAVIPKENPNKLTVDRGLLFNSVKRVMLYSNKTTYQTRLKIVGSELQVSAEDFDFNNAANERITCSYIGDDMEIGFNAKFLVDMLSNLDSENIILEMSQPNRAGIIVPEIKDNNDEDILMLVMPVMLNS